MLELKKTTKWDGKLKGIRIEDGQVVNVDGEIIDLISILEKCYEDKYFDLSVTSKEEEIIPVEVDDEVDIDELTADKED